MHSTFVLALLPLFDIAVAAEAKCYGLDGTELDSTYGPCKPGARHSGCCAIHRPAGSVDICLDNGLCMATNDEYMGTIWQDGCTDPTGKDPGCPKMCPDANDNFDGLKPVLAWNIQMCDYGTYCCREVNDRRNCCNNATAPTIQTKNLGAFQFETSTAGISFTDVATSSIPQTSSSEPTRAAATTVSASSPITPTAQPAADTGELCKKEKEKARAVGGALGGIMSAVIIGLLGVIFWMHKKEKHQRRIKEHYEAQFEQSWAYRRTIVVESDSREISTPSEKSPEFSESYKAGSLDP